MGMSEGIGLGGRGRSLGGVGNWGAILREKWGSKQNKKR